MPRTLPPGATQIKGPYRVIKCGFCPWSASLPRRGAGRTHGTWHGNALATVAKLVGKLNEHTRQAHPEFYEEESN